MHRRAVDVRKMALAGIFAAFMAVCAWFSVPVLEIAFTMQSFAVFLALGVLGGKWGTVSIGIYLLLGFVGMPVFSGFRGGPGVLLGPTGGYLLGFLLSGLIYWLVTGIFGNRPGVRLAGLLLGQLGCYALGSGWFVLLYGGKASLSWVLLTCVAPYLVPDGLKLGLSAVIARRIFRQIQA